MFQRLNERLRRFMIGRYGSDELTRFLLFAVLALILLRLILLPLILRFPLLSDLIEGGELLLLLCACWRMISRRFEARRRENEAYLRLRFSAAEAFRGLRFRAGQARQYKIFCCPGCGQKVRVPRGHGKISVRCPRCGREFIKRS